MTSFFGFSSLILDEGERASAESRICDGDGREMGRWVEPAFFRSNSSVRWMHRWRGNLGRTAGNPTRDACACGFPFSLSFYFYLFLSFLKIYSFCDGIIKRISRKKKSSCSRQMPPNPSSIFPRRLS
ncbi:hypothetical protein AA313_de0204602 [Arthrobotrys entomopaga]|nr:hypothetical protein AA313_de0204602 [Arthrobotrys entomopaga]